MRPVAVVIFHAEAPRGAGPLTRALAEARHSLAGVQKEAWLAAGADSVTIVSGPPDGLSFGERLTALVASGGAARMSGGESAAAGGMIVSGSGGIPLARPSDLRRFVAVAGGPARQALANNRYSADVIALSRAADLEGLPPLPADNALPRWLEERVGLTVSDLASRWRLGVDVDTPLDLLILAPALPASPDLRAIATSLHGTAPLIDERLAAISEILRDRRAELLVAGRVSTSTLRWLERGSECRIRALVEERGLRAASRLAQSNPATGRAGSAVSRRPRSVLGELLDRDGPDSLATTVARLADAAVIDTRVLMAHRFGAQETAWPGPEDRYGSDLLPSDHVTDPWLAALTASAASAGSGHSLAGGPSTPILFGGHTMVNGGLRLLAERAARAERAKRATRSRPSGELVRRTR